MRVPFQSAGRHATTRLGVHSQRRLAHLITPWRVESRLIFARPTLFGPFQRYQPFSSQSMATLDSATQALAALSITPSSTVEHASASSPAEWKGALQTAPGAPKEFELLKFLVFKPKTAKGATSVPVVVVARDTTETSSSSLAKHLNLKDLRLASEDLLSEFFSLDKDSCKFLPVDFTFPALLTLALFSEPFDSQSRDVPQSHHSCRYLPSNCTGPTRRACAFFTQNTLPLRSRHLRLFSQTRNCRN